MKKAGRLIIATVLLATLGAPTLATSDLLLEGSEFQVNTYTTDWQYATPARSVARAPDGSFVVVWMSYGQDGNSAGVLGQRYDSAGAPAGSEFVVNSYTTDVQERPAVSVAGDGSFVVVWTSLYQDGNGLGVFGQRYDDTGAAAGTEFQINSYTTNWQFSPAVAAAPDGSFVVVWQSYGQDGDVAASVHGQRYDNAGAAVGTEFLVNTYTTSAQWQPAVATAADGSFVVVWSSIAGQDGSFESIQAQRYDSTGAPDGTEFQVNSYTTGFQGSPAVSAEADGGFVVVWTSYVQDGSAGSVHGQLYDDTGAAVGTEFRANSYTTSWQLDTAVAVAPNGDFVVVWSSYSQDGYGYGVHGQRYDSAGAAAGTEFQLNSYTTYDQGYPSVAIDAGGDFVVVWQSWYGGSYGQDGDGGGIFGQRVCVDDNANTVCDRDEAIGDCGVVPATGCLTGTKASFQVKDNADDTKDQVKWKLSNGGELDQADLGDPTTSRTYSLCIYDETASSPSLVAGLAIAPSSTKWVTKDPKGFQYKDKAGASDGVTKAKLKTGAAGKSQAQVQGKGTAIPMPTPLSMTEIFDQDTKVIVQLVNNETATCWTSEFTTNTKNDGVQFKAKTP